MPTFDDIVATALGKVTPQAVVNMIRDDLHAIFYRQPFLVYRIHSGIDFSSSVQMCLRALPDEIKDQLNELLRQEGYAIVYDRFNYSIMKIEVGNA